MKFLKNKVLVGLLLLLTAETSRATAIVEVDFVNAVHGGLIEYESVAPETGRSVELSVENKSASDLLITVEAGTYFVSESRYQPRVITRLKQFFIKRGERRRLGLNARCGNAVAMAAPVGTPLELGGIVDAECQQILDSLGADRLDDHHLVQKIIWMYTNNRPLADLHPRDTDPRVYARIMHVVAAAQGTKFRDEGYRVDYEDADGGLRFSGIPKHLSGQVPVALNDREAVAVQIVNPAGEVLRVGAIHFPPFNAVQELGFTLDVAGLEPGAYELQVVTAAANPAIVGRLAIAL